MSQSETQPQYSNLLSLIKHLEIQSQNSSITTQSQLVLLQSQITELTTKQNSISNQHLYNKSKVEKIDEFAAFITKANDLFTTHEIRINQAIKDISNAKYRYDKIILDNLHVPGFIGDYCKFKNLREYLDINIKEMEILKNYSRKSELDAKSYKEKLEALMKDFQKQIGSFGNQQKKYAEDVKKEAFEYIDQCRNDFYTKHDEILLVNHKYAFELREQSSKMMTQWEAITQIKNEVEAKVNKTIDDMKAESKKTLEIFNFNNNEFARIKSKFAEMVEFIKDVRFKRNLVEHDVVSRKDLRNLTDKLKFTKKTKARDIREAKALDLNYDVYIGKEVKNKSYDSDECKRPDRSLSRREEESKINHPPLTPPKRTSIKLYPKAIQENIENSASEVINQSNYNIQQRYVEDNTSFKEKDPSSCNNSEMKNESILESRNHKVLQKQMSAHNIDKSHSKHQQNPHQHQKYPQPSNNEWRLKNIHKVKESMNGTMPLLNNQYLLNTVDVSTYNVKQIRPQPLKPSRPRIGGLKASLKSPSVEGALITLHYKENKSANCIFGYENKDKDKKTIALALKPSNFDNRKRVGFTTSKEYDKVIDKMFLSTSPQMMLNSKLKNKLIDQTTRNKRDVIKKELIDCTIKNKLKYETLKKILSNSPKSRSKIDEKNEEEQMSKTLDLNI